MLDYVAKVSEEARRPFVNDDLFSRKFESPLYEHVIDILENLRIIPGLRLKSYEIIPYAANAMFDKNNTKNKSIRNNQALDRVVNINESHHDLLRLTFEKDVDGVVEEEIKEIYCPSQNKSHQYILNGKKVLPVNQVVDNSTYVNTETNHLLFRTPIFSFPIALVPTTMIEETTGGNRLKGRKFNIKVFKFTSNIFYYYLAKFGVFETIKYFKLDKFISIVPKEINIDKYHYIKILDDIYIEILKDKCQSEPFILDFAMTLLDAIRPVDPATARRKKVSHKCVVETFSDLFDKELWLMIFSETYSKKRSVKTARSGLLSFERLADPTAIKRLTSINIQHRKDIYTLISYLLTNYDPLMAKDNFDIANRRLRNNEMIASLFDETMRNNMNTLLNSGNFSKERIDRLLNSISHSSIYKSMNDEDALGILRYERYNDNTIIELSRFTMKGRGSVSGGKYQTPLPNRDIYPSYLGRLDVFVCSATDPGLTGYLCANPRLHEKGRFSKKKDPDFYDDKILSLAEKVTSSNTEERAYLINKHKFLTIDGKFKPIIKKKTYNPKAKFKIVGKPNGKGFTILELPKRNIDGKIIVKITPKKEAMIDKTKYHKYNLEGKLLIENLFTEKGLKHLDRAEEINTRDKKKK